MSLRRLLFAVSGAVLVAGCTTSDASDDGPHPRDLGLEFSSSDLAQVSDDPLAALRDLPAIVGEIELPLDRYRLTRQEQATFDAVILAQTLDCLDINISFEVDRRMEAIILDLPSRNARRYGVSMEDGSYQEPNSFDPSDAFGEVWMRAFDTDCWWSITDDLRYYELYEADNFLSRIGTETFDLTISFAKENGTFSTWRRCMAEAGAPHHGTPLDAARTHALAGGESASVAATDVRCKTETALIESLVAIERHYQEQAISVLGEDLAVLEREWRSARSHIDAAVAAGVVPATLG